MAELKKIICLNHGLVHNCILIFCVSLSIFKNPSTNSTDSSDPNTNSTDLSDPNTNSICKDANIEYLRGSYSNVKYPKEIWIF